ncbi:MAG: alpha/beta fold hydrolase, partial [Planctomycetes bacterium]|nr:alpha/beta fold hydrolase [Planctomycetota bacterium]
QYITNPRDECRVARDVAAAHRMILVSPDYRAKTSWMGPKAEADLVQIIGDLRREYRVGRAFMVGGSMGASAALTFAALHPDLVAGVAAMNGTANHLEYDNFQDAIRESFGGTKAEIPGEYKKRSAEYWPERFTMPVGITAGGTDQSVPPDSVMRLARVLDRMNRPVLLIYRENGGHSTNYADARRIIEFVIDRAPPAASAPAAASAPTSAPATATRPASSTPSTLEEAVAWLIVKSFEMIRGCRRAMAHGRAAFPPQVGRDYDAFWQLLRATSGGWFPVIAR